MRKTTFWVFWKTDTASCAHPFDGERGARHFADGLTVRGAIRLERHEPSAYHTHYDVSSLDYDAALPAEPEDLED